MPIGVVDSGINEGTRRDTGEITPLHRHPTLGRPNSASEEAEEGGTTRLNPVVTPVPAIVQHAVRAFGNLHI